MHSTENPRQSPFALAIGAGIWLLSVGVLVFLFVFVPPPFQESWVVVKWVFWCGALAIAGLAFLVSTELFVNPLLQGSGEPGQAIIRTGAFGIGLLVIVFLLIRLFLD